MILASNPDRAVTVRERDPTYPGSEMMCPGDREALWLTKSMGIRSVIRSRSLTVTALSCDAYFMISWRMKFQLSVPPAGLPHSRKKLLVKGK